MPVYRPTADSIWNSFRNSGKRHLLLTGSRGIGKTTRLAQLVPDGTPRIITWAERGKGVFLRETVGGKTARIGSFDETLPGTEKRMRPDKDGFVSLGIPALERCAQAEGEWAFIDEIGYLECEYPDYCDAVWHLMEQKRLLAVVRKQELPFLQSLYSRGDVFLIDLDRPFGRLGCVIMASGEGKRFGGNKLMADFDGMPMLCRALDATDDIFAERIVVTRHADVEALCRERNVPVVRHDFPYRSDTVRLGLQAIGSAVDGCLFCPGDQPLLRHETVAALAMAAVHDRTAIWRAAFGEAAGTPVLFPKRLFPELLSLPRGKGGGILLKKYPEQIRTVSVRDRYELEDVDTPEDLARLRNIRI